MDDETLLPELIFVHAIINVQSRSVTLQKKKNTIHLSVDLTSETSFVIVLCVKSLDKVFSSLSPLLFSFHNKIPSSYFFFPPSPPLISTPTPPLSSS